MIVIEDNRALSGSLHGRIARALGWTERETTSFSLASLRDLVRPVDPELAREIDDEMHSGRYVTRKNRAMNDYGVYVYDQASDSWTQEGPRSSGPQAAFRAMQLKNAGLVAKIAQQKPGPMNRAGKKRNRAVDRRAPDLGRNRLTVFPITVHAGGREEMGYGHDLAFDPGANEMLPHEILREHGIAVVRFDGDASGGWIAVHDYDLASAVKTLRAYGGKNRAVGGRLTPEERASAPSKIEKKLAEPEAWRGFSIEPANDTVGMPGSVWVHREPDGAVVVRKLGGSFFVRIDREGDAYSARVWLIGDPPQIGRVETSRRTLDSAIHWATEHLTREERQEGTRQRMEARHDVETAAGMELPVGAVVRFRDRGARRRYVVATVNRFGSGSTAWTDYNLVALSGSERGSAPSARREQLALDDDQTVRFEGAIARKLEWKYKTRSSH